MLEVLPVKSTIIVPQEDLHGSTEVWVPPFMDDLFIPLSDPDPVCLIDRVIRAAQVLDRVAAAVGFVIQYGQGKNRGFNSASRPRKKGSTTDS